MLQGKVCAVFGGSRGIGQAICEEVARCGARVAVLSRNVVACRETAGLLCEPGSHLALECNVSEEQSVKQACKEVEEKLGPVDVLVNAAGIRKDSLLMKASHADLTRQLHINLLGPMLTSKYLLPGMLRRRTGSIVQIGSVVGLSGNAGQCAYSASKAGLVGFTRSLAKEVASRGIRVNLVSPGFVLTDMLNDLPEKTLQLAKGRVPLGRLGESKEIAETVLYLATSSYITGQVRASACSSW